MIVSQIEAAKHCKVEDEPALVAPYLEAAEDAVQAHLNRRVFADQAALDAALDVIPDDLSQAQAAYDAAKEAADAEADATRSAATLAVAEARLNRARQQAESTLHGIVANPSLKAAVLLTVGNLFENREGVVVGASVAELPQGVRELLRPYRRVMMP